MAQIDVESRVRRLVWECAPVRLTEPPDDSQDLSDSLGYHSVVLTELALSLSDEFGIDVLGSSGFEEIKTVGDVVEQTVLLVARTHGTQP